MKILDSIVQLSQSTVRRLRAIRICRMVLIRQVSRMSARQTSGLLGGGHLVVLHGQVTLD